MIGVFDSGLGGLSVLAALVDSLPQADFIYYADTAHVPYGNKSETHIRERVLAIGGHLVAAGCTLVVVACNTATAAAVDALRQAHPQLPVVGVEPGIKPAAVASRSGKIAVLATEATARSERLSRLIRTHASEVTVHVEPCPGWATHVEMLQLDDPALHLDASRRLEPLLDQGVDQIVLGCTHYSFLKSILHKVIGQRAELVDVSTAVARQTLRLAGAAAEGDGTVRLESSINEERLIEALPIFGLDNIRARLRQSDQ